MQEQMRHRAETGMERGGADRNMFTQRGTDSPLATSFSSDLAMAMNCSCFWGIDPRPSRWLTAMMYS